MAAQNWTDSPQWRWDWEILCGAGGFKIWDSKIHDLGLCFQQLCLDIPVLSILATTSAYYFGRQIEHVVRGTTQLVAINLRCAIVACLATLPILLIYIDLNKSDNPIPKISYFLSAVEGIAWFTHLGYMWGLRTRLGLSPRGPVFMCILWSLLAVLSVISLRTNLLIFSLRIDKNFSIALAYSFSIVKVILQILYGLTLLPSEGSTTYIIERHHQTSESQPLLYNAYSGFLEENDPNYLGVAMEDSSWLSKLLFYWVNPMMKKGVEEKLTQTDDLYDLPDSLSCGIVSLKLDKALIGNIDDVQKRIATHIHEYGAAISSSDVPNSVPDVALKKIKRHNVSMLKALHKCFGFQFYGIGILKLTGDCLGFAGPMLLNRLVNFIENKYENIELGYAYAAGLFITTLLAAFCNSHFNFYMAMVGLKIRAALVTTVYRKTLTVGGTVLNSAFSVGEIVNFMSTDADRIVNSCPSFHALWSIPFQIAVTLYLLYIQVGLAFLAGLAFSILLIPINKLIANKIGELSTKMMERKDERVKMMTEVLRGIRTIKLHVWEQHFIRLITRMRDAELKYLKGRKYLDALCVYFWATTPVLISVLTFGTYVLMGNKLTAATVFTSMALLNMLIGPLNAFPWVLNGMTEAWVSIKRIQRLLELPDLDLDTYYDNDLINDQRECDVIIKSAGFGWGKALSTEEKAKLHIKKLRAVKDKGKGKKSARRSVQERVEPERVDQEEADNEGEFRINNINLVVKKGEFIGVIGTVGSGKSSLLSAILAELSKEQGYIAVAELDRGFGYVTQQPWLQRGTIRDNILFGRTFDDSKYNKVIHACCLVDDLLLLPAGDLTGVGEGGMTLSGGQKARVALARAVYQDKPIYLLDDIISAVDVKVAKHIFQYCIMGLLKNKTRILCTHHVQHLINADRIIVMENGTIKQEGKPADVLSDIDEFLPIDLELGTSINSQITNSTTGSIQTTLSDDNDSVLNNETRETGTVQYSVYSSYWKAIGHLLSISILIAMIIMQTSRNMTDWWLSFWVSNAEGENGTTPNNSHSAGDKLVLWLPLEQESGDNLKYYMTIYGVFAGLNSLFTLFRAFLFAYGGIAAASKIHKLLLKSIVKAKVAFFDISPLGRILNRFSSDTYTVDDSLPFILNILLAQLFGVIGSIVVTVYGLPWLCLILVPLIPVYHWLQHHYRLTSRELKRLSSVTLSPVYSHFSETIQGLPTIRALRATQRFRRDNEDNVDANVKAQFASQAASQWLGLRLQFIGVAMVTGVGFIAVVQHQYDVANPGLVGLAISYALSITGLLSGVVNAFTETEREMIAVERVNQYIEEVAPETTHFVMDPPYAWPSQGVISFDNVVLKYREHLAPALKGISFETRPAEKIGVVGRTGAGKSSILVSLFRQVELHSGSICIDSVNISHISISALRSRLSCIPQDPFLFSGTIRDNLDPLDEFKDAELLSALSRVDLGPTVKRLGGLDYVISSGGSNLSAGQKQLFCLARAVLHSAKILCIDEATANVDQETDRQIQQTLRSAFRKSTVITIAHRVQTVLDCDRVLVMGDGQILEFDQPYNLLADASSYFYRIVNNE